MKNLTTLVIAILFSTAVMSAQVLNSGSPAYWGPVEAVAAESGLKAGMIDPKNNKKIKYWVAPMDPTYIRNEPGKSLMGMDLVPVYEEEGAEKEPASTIRIDPITIQNMGVRLGAVERKKLTREMRAFGNITYDETRLFTVNTKFNGWIEKLYVDFVGVHVEKGQPLFDIYSPEVLTAQQEYLLAYQQYHNLPRKSAGNMKRTSERLLKASRLRLLYWDMDASQIEHIEKTGSVQKAITIHSPASGVVIKKNAFEGHYVKAGVHQFEIADLTRVWVDVDIYEYELPWIQNGMPATMELAYIPGNVYQGQVLFVYPYMNTKTRTATLRLAFDNPRRELKPGMWANVQLTSELPEDALVIPQEAVIDSGVRQVVFVALGKGKFQPREVRLGVEGNSHEIQVLEGLSVGEKIVLSGQFLLDSESRLREAIQKMLQARAKTDDGSSMPSDGDQLNMDGLTMDAGDDLDMRGITMDN